MLPLAGTAGNAERAARAPDAIEPVSGAGYSAAPAARFAALSAADVTDALERVEGHRGEPMLILERAYPDAQGKEDKRRLMEHLMRRARTMNIAAAFPTEYYWDAASTRRGARKGIVDMNDVIEELDQRYGTSVTRQTLTVTNPAGSSPSIYIDSAPYELAHIGRIPSRKTGVKARRYDGRVDNTYTNVFMVLDQPSESDGLRGGSALPGADQHRDG